MAAVVSVLETLKNLPKSKKDVMIPLEHLKTDPLIQIRFKPGEETFGFKTTFTSTYTEGLKARIVEEGAVLVPLVVWKTGDNEYTIIRGNTRYQVCKELIADPHTPQGLMANIKKLKCEVYEGITREQALSLVNDQDQQRYNKADFVNLCWKLAQSGWTYYDIALQFTDLYAEYVGTVQAKNKLAEFRVMSNRSTQMEFIKKWARGALDQGVLLAQKLGTRIQKTFLLKAAELSGLLGENDEKPEFNPLVGDRLRELKKLADQDPKWNVTDGGEMFNIEVQKYIDEDQGILNREVKARPTVKMLEGLKTTVKSLAFKTAYDVTLGNKPENAEGIDAMTFRNEQVIKTLEELLPSIKHEEIAMVIATILRSSNTTEIVQKLAKFV